MSSHNFYPSKEAYNRFYNSISEQNHSFYKFIYSTVLAIYTNQLTYTKIITKVGINFFITAMDFASKDACSSF